MHQFVAETSSYQNYCEEHQLFTDSGNYSTTAEALFRYITDNADFEEAHTALADSVIETNILFFCLASGAVLGQHYKTKQSIRRNCIYTLDVIDGFTGEILLSAPYQRIKINKGKTQIVLD